MALTSMTNVRPLIHDPDVGVAMAAASASMSSLPSPQGLEAGIEALGDARAPVQEYLRLVARGAMQ